jgi:hypothetical protein
MSVQLFEQGGVGQYRMLVEQTLLSTSYICGHKIMLVSPLLMWLCEFVMKNGFNPAISSVIKERCSATG